MIKAASSEGSNVNDQVLKWDRMAKLFLVVVPLLVFGPAVLFEFVDWDDDVNILENPHVAALGWAEIKWMFTNVERAHRYLPLGWLAYAVERTLWGADPFVFHLGNLLLHLANGLLLYGILKRVLGLATGAPQSQPAGLVAAAAMGGLFWALNPLRVEVVAWCSARIYLLATLWFFLSLWSYLKSSDAPSPARWRWQAWIFYALSLMTYPVALLGGGVFVLLDWLVLRSLPGSPRKWFQPAMRQVWIEKIPVLALSGGWLLLVVATRHVGVEPSHTDTLAAYDVPHRVMQGLYGWVYYLWKPWLPLHLAPRYGNLIGFDPLEPRFLLSALVVLGLTVASLAWGRRCPVLLGGWVAHLILFLPFIGLAKYPHSLYDRYTYGAGLVWSVLVAVGLWQSWLQPRLRNGFFITGALFLCGLAVLSSRQTLIWQNSATLRLCMAETFGTRPGRSVHEEKAGSYFRGKGDLNQALTCFRLAVLHDPANHDARIGLGNTLADLGREEEALAQLDLVVQDGPTDLGSRLNLGVALCKLGRREEGVAIFQGILRDDPKHLGAQHNLKLSLEHPDQPEGYDRARQQRPSDWEL